MDKKINMLDLHRIQPYISHLSLTFLVAKLKKKNIISFITQKEESYLLIQANGKKSFPLEVAITQEMASWLSGLVVISEGLK